MATVCVIGTIGATVGAAAGAARERDPAAARLAEEGYAHYGEARFGEAVAAFERAYATDPDPVFLYNIGKCRQQMGELPAALEALEAYRAAAPDAPNRAAVDGDVRYLEEKIALTMRRVSVASEPPGAALYLDGAAAPAGVTPWRGWLPFGAHALRLVLAGHVPVDESAEVTKEGPAELRYALTSETAPGTLDLRGVPAGARIELDGRPLGVAPLAAAPQVAPGPHRVRVLGADGAVSEHDVAVAPGAVAPVAVELPVRLAGEPAVATTVADAPRGRGFEVPWYGWTTIGLTAAGLGTGIAFIVLAKQKADEAAAYTNDPDTDFELTHWQDLVDERDRNMVISYVGFGVAGAAAVGSGLILWLHNTGGEAEADAPVTLAPLGPDTVGLTVQGPF